MNLFLPKKLILVLIILLFLEEFNKGGVFFNHARKKNQGC